MARRLSQGRTKVTILVDEPEDPQNPTASELTAGNDASCNIRMDGFNFTAQASNTQPTTSLCDRSESVTPTNRQHVGEMTVERGFDPEGLPDETGDDDTAQLILDNIDSKVWIYVRETAKWSTDDWEEGDEFRIGGGWLVDVPERGNLDDNIKFTARFLPQGVHDYGEVATEVAG